MDRAFYEKLKTFLKKTNISKNELCSLLYAENFSEAIDLLSEFFEENFQEILLDEEFFENYLLFIYNFIKLLDTDDLYTFKLLIEKNIKTIKSYLKDYNKTAKQKDYYYNNFSICLNKLKETLNFIDVKINYLDEYEEFKIVWFIITKLKKCDYFYRILELYPNYANIKNRDNRTLFTLLIEYFLVNIKDLNDEEIKYYKRIFVMLLESDKLRLTNEELYSILNTLEKNMISASIENKKDINFIIKEIDRHYEIINQDSRVNAVDYCFKKCPIIIEERLIDKREDFTKDFIFSIDCASTNNRKILIDDAFSFKDNQDGTYFIYMHIPDVDFYVKKDSFTDEYMRSIGESVYAKDYKTPMIPYEIAQKCSLIAGEERPTITVRAHIDANGNLLNLDFFKGIVKVNYNLSRKQAEIFMSNNSDKRLFVLNQLYDITSLMRKNRKEKIGKRSKPFVIMDEINIFMDLITADYFSENGIVFPYKNYLGKRSSRNVDDVSECEKFATLNSLSDEGKNILYNVFDINNRVYYDTVNHGNKSFNGVSAGNIGNPLREYISLETDRLIKDLVIENLGNYAYWEERILRDCIEYTETSAKIKGLYNKNN